MNILRHVRVQTCAGVDVRRAMSSEGGVEIVWFTGQSENGETWEGTDCSPLATFVERSFALADMQLLRSAGIDAPGIAEIECELRDILTRSALSSE